MNKFLRQGLIICLILFFHSCSNKSQMGQKGFDNEHQILLKVGKESEKTQFFREYFELETVIPIETTDDFLMDDGIKRVIKYKDKLIILDRRSAIFLVNYSSGKVESYFRRIGQGPGESRQILDIGFDEQNETILVFNDYNNLLFFDMKGNYIKQESFKKLFENIIYHDGNVLLYNDGIGYSCFPYKIEKYNLQNKKLEIIGRNNKIDFNKRLFGNQIVKSKNIWFGTPIDFDLNQYSDSKIESIYKLEPKTSPLTKEKMQLGITDSRKFQDERLTIMYGIASIRETDHFLVFRSSKNGIFILHKQTNEIHWEEFVNETSLGLRLNNYFPHNGDDNLIMFILRPFEWLYLRKDTKMNELLDSLKEKIESFEIKEDNNLILIFYREK